MCKARKKIGDQAEYSEKSRNSPGYNYLCYDQVLVQDFCNQKTDAAR